MDDTKLPSSTDAALTCGQWATLACLLEAIAPKPGNVHRGADFEDLTFADLAVSAVLIGPVMDAAPGRAVGKTVLDAVRKTRQCVASNSNLGMILLLAPLAAVPLQDSLQAGVRTVLAGLTAEDAADVYQAIRLARPGGMGTESQMDVAGQAPPSLLTAMQRAQHRDLVARQYVTGFEDIFARVVPWLVEESAVSATLTAAIVRTHVRLMSETPDSLIARKSGEAVARQAQVRAAQALEAGPPGDQDYEVALRELDFWLRCDGHRRNPGTTADLIAAGLFVGLRERFLLPPWR